MLAYDYPLLGIAWSMLIFFIWVAWILLVFRTISDLFRAKDIGGVGKALWLFFVIAVPWLGVLSYLIIHGGDMAQRDVEQAQAQQDAFAAYVRGAAGTGSSVDQLKQLADLHSSGALTDAEFAAQKAKLLA